MILVLWCCKGYKCLRFCLHFIWNLLYFITILTFIIGSAFGVVGVVITDAVPALNVVFSTDYLKNNLFKDDLATAARVDICLNGDGDLSKTWDFENGNLGAIVDLYEAAATLKSVQAEIKANADSKAITDVKNYYDVYASDIRITTSEQSGSNTLSSMFTNCDMYSNSLEQGTYQTSSCSSKTQDVLRQSQNLCPEGYAFVQGGAATADDSKNCLTIQSWTAEQLQARYSGRPSGCNPPQGDFNSFANAITSYYNGFKNYMLENTNLLGQLTGEMDNLNKQFIKIAGNLSNSIDNISGIINPLIELYKGIVGDGGFKDLINCSKHSP
jgi:hypothetical protein